MENRTKRVKLVHTLPSYIAYHIARSAIKKHFHFSKMGFLRDIMEQLTAIFQDAMASRICTISVKDINPEEYAEEVILAYQRMSGGRTPSEFTNQNKVAKGIGPYLAETIRAVFLIVQDVAQICPLLPMDLHLAMRMCAWTWACVLGLGLF